VVIMTSNLGAEMIIKGVTAGGEFMEGTKERVLTQVRQHFRPEFLNRLSDIVVFTPLTRTELRSIIGIQLNRIGERLQGRRIRLVLSDAALERILKEGYDPLLGARPLKRYLERQVTNALSRRIISGELVDGTTVVLKPDGDDGLDLEIEITGKDEGDNQGKGGPAAAPPRRSRKAT
jgi:ATP-dependent Clp protease ATP-binding subunit ClpB